MEIAVPGVLALILGDTSPRLKHGGSSHWPLIMMLCYPIWAVDYNQVPELMEVFTEEMCHPLGCSKGTLLGSGND